MDFDKVEVLVYTNRIRQNKIVVYPKLDKNASYRLNGKDMMGGIQIYTEGMDVVLSNNFTTRRITLERI